jgi:hypothetical protein
MGLKNLWKISLEVVRSRKMEDLNASSSSSLVAKSPDGQYLSAAKNWTGAPTISALRMEP